MLKQKYNPKNKFLIDEFNKLRKQIRFDMDHTTNKKKRLVHSFRLQAIDKVINILLNFKNEITSASQLEGIKGIGKGTLRRIDEILKHGKLNEINPDILDQKYLQYIDELAEIYGIGDRTAYDLYRTYGVTSIEELKKLYESGGITLPTPIITGLKWYGIVQDNIPREEIDEINTYLQKILLRIDPQLFGVICGSYRRWTLTSGDIDMLLIHPNIKVIPDKDKLKVNYLAIFIKYLFDDGILVDSLTETNVSTKYMGYCRLDKNHPVRRIDIRFIPYNSYYSASIYFTGPKDFNRKMRSLAIIQGYSLNEYGITDVDNNKIINPSSEKEVFDILGMEYISPNNRK